MGKLTGKVAIVTGASRGIGREIAIALAKEGAGIAINYSKDEEGGRQTLKLLEELGVSAIEIKRNISDFNEAEGIVTETINHFGRVDILVNNAGISKVGLFLDSSKDEIDNLISINLVGALYLSRHVLPHMLARGGSILNISSIWGETGASMEVLYSATKGGINLFTKSLAKEMAPSKIRVNGIAPGVIDTKMNSFLSEEDRQNLEEEIPLGRFGLPEEIGRVAVFLCSEDASYITGEIIKVDGGML